MKRFLLLIGFMTLCSSVHAAIALSSFTYAWDNNTGQSTTTLSPMNCTGANFVAVMLSANFLDAVSQVTITDNVGGNTYAHTTERTDTSGNPRNGVIWYAANANVSAAMKITATCAGGTCFIGYVAACYSGVAQSSPLDVENSSSPVAALTKLTTNSVTPANNNELLLAVISRTNSDAIPLSVDSGFTFEEGSSNNTAAVADYANLVQGTAGAVSPVFTYTTAKIGVGFIATFKAINSAPHGGAKMMILERHE